MNSWYAAGVRPAAPGGGGGGAATTQTMSFRERCEELKRRVGNRSSWDIGLLLAVSVVVIVVSAVSIAFFDQGTEALIRYRAVFRLVRERRLVAAHHLPDPEVFVRVDEEGEQHETPRDLQSLRDAAYWLNVAVIFVASVVLVVSVGALAIRNLPPLGKS